MTKVIAMLLLACGFGSALAQAADELLNDGRNTDNVTTFGMGDDLRMYGYREAA